SLLKIDAVYMTGGQVCLEWEHANPAATLPAIAIFSTTNMNSGTWQYAGENNPSNGINIWQEAPSQQLFYKLVVTNAP
ncbi:hypothetical protein BVX97_00650, partial [bacterium E08(2017)]